MNVKPILIIVKYPIKGKSIVRSKFATMFIVLIIVARLSDCIDLLIPFVNIMLREKPVPITNRIKAMLIGVNLMNDINRKPIPGIIV